MEGKSLIPVSMCLSFPGCSVMATIWINQRMLPAVITCNTAIDVLLLTQLKCLTVSACRYSFMLQCWESEPGKRPPFSELVQSLSVALESMAGYVPLCQQSSESDMSP